MFLPVSVSVLAINCICCPRNNFFFLVLHYSVTTSTSSFLPSFMLVFDFFCRYIFLISHLSSVSSSSSWCLFSFLYFLFFVFFSSSLWSLRLILIRWPNSNFLGIVFSIHVINSIHSLCFFLIISCTVTLSKLTSRRVLSNHYPSFWNLHF